MRVPGLVPTVGLVLVGLLSAGCAGDGATGTDDAASPADTASEGEGSGTARGSSPAADEPADATADRRSGGAGEGADASSSPEAAAGADARDPAGPPDEIAPFEDPERLAALLASAETALARPSTPEEDRDGWAAVQQQAYRDLAASPEWRDGARQAVPEGLRDAFDRNVEAAVALRELTSPREELPDWRIVPPPPVDELRGHYEEAEAATGAPWHVLAAIHLVETRFGRIRGDSHAGARGPMQFMPATWDAYGEGEVTDPRDAILAAGRYLADHGAPQDLRSALFAYNRSERYVDAVLAYARTMAEHEHYLDAYHGWRVYYRTVDGDVLLEEGYGD